jgi:hypothetical protein
MGRHRSRRLFSIVAMCRPDGPSNSRKLRSPINNQGVQTTNQKQDLRSSDKSAVKNGAFFNRAVLQPQMTPILADSNSYNLSELNTIQGGVASPCLSSSLPFCPKNEIPCFNVAVTRHAATLDTEPPAKSYPGGSRTHLFSNHFQYARASICYGFLSKRLVDVKAL